MTSPGHTTETIPPPPPNNLSNIILSANRLVVGGDGGGGGGGDDDDGSDGLGHKIMISVHRGKKTITKIEGIPNKFNLSKILKKLKSKDVLSCGGHIANDKETGKDFIVLQGSFSAEIAEFLTQEGITEGRFIVHRG